MNLIQNCIKKLQLTNQPIKIVFVEGHSKRMIEAAKKLVEDKVVEPIMLFETQKQYNEVFDLVNNLTTIILEDNRIVEELAKEYEKLRKGKETFDQALTNLKTAQFFAAMLVRTGKADGALGGVHLATRDILKAAFKVIEAKEGIKTISSVMIMAKENETLLFGDISVNPKPSAIQLADIGQNANEFAKAFGIEEKIAFLSFSTSGSANTPETKLVVDAVKIFNERKCSKNSAIGEIQFDAAFVESVKSQKYKYNHNYDGTAKIFIFPDLNAGNIGYKIAQRMGGWSAMGPIITGLKQPFNDLSRGSTVQNVIDSAIVTATQALAQKGRK